ncbi:MAG TPA: glycoside hydrolase family 16 protein [Chthoniobacteraceae bacterium]|jgi:beta-glucanase (GH16 family)|nr:glycoside hydrolase family 16 protein [Chthoniobacteraceae bacterium]
MIALPASRLLRTSRLFSALVLALLICAGRADETAQPLLEMKAGAEGRLTPSSKQVTVTGPATAPGVVVAIQPGNEEYPGVRLKPEAGAWNLSKFGHIEARVVNLGEKPLALNLRVDNPSGENNTENVYLNPGETRTIVTIFGFAFGKKPAYPLKPDAVSAVLVFATKASAPQSFRIESLQAAGPAGEKPPVDPESIRVRPENGLLLGQGVKLTAGQMVAQAGAVVKDDGGSLKATFSQKGQSVRLKPPQGKWDLREAVQVRVKIKNTGTTAATLLARVESPAGSTDQAVTDRPLPPGATGELVVHFIPAVPWTGIKDANRNEWNPTAGTGTKFTSDAVTGVTLAAVEGAGPQELEIQSIVAEAPPVAVPEWLGRRPPVPGEWTQTFSEEFDGHEVDLRKWNIYSANYWDKQSHFSKDNVIVENGVARLRYARHPGRHNDDPKGKETPYATGFLDTYGKWVQRYGYFEARMKLPQAPGLWPAMWLMPDRGVATGEQWLRASTSHGAMEFDVMEFLSRWGVHRFNIAFHWDGYEKDHKQTGSSTIYTGADKDGFITAGLLWTPGQAEIYCNGTLVAHWESTRISHVPSDLMFTHVMGGWDNNALDDKQLPDEFVIDYVRCWQRKDLASDVDGVKSTEPSPAAPVRAK